MPNFFQPAFHDVVSAMTYSLAKARASSAGADFDPPLNDVTEFIVQQHGRMPDVLGAALKAATLGFDASGLAGFGGRFHTRLPELREKQIGAWKTSRFAFRRDLIRYFESLATLLLYSGERGSGVLTPAPSSIPASAHASRVISNPPANLRFQAVVIGSGPGGAITAALLAEAGRNVLLIEEGPYLSLDSCTPFTVREMTQKYRNGGQTVALGKNKIAYVEGRCVGGGSEINSGLYHRTPPEILSHWRKEFAVTALSDSELRPHFEACERDVSVSACPDPAQAAGRKLQAGADALGWKSLEVPRWCRYEPSGSRRQSMTETYVPRFLAAGGRLLPNTRVLQLRSEVGRWQLDARHAAAGKISIEAETLFVCGGAVHTPALLRRSGITRNIGNSLRLHPTIKLTARFPDHINSAAMGVPAHQVKEFSPRLSFGCSVSSPGYLALGLLDHPQALNDVPAAWTQMANFYAIITGEGRGSVRTVPGFRDPLVRFRITQSDRRDLSDGLAKLSEMLFAAGALEIYPGVARAPILRKRDDLRALPAVLPDGLASLITIHLFSSCPMGENKSKCAADSFGRVHGFNNLYISDASLLCTAPGVNPQGSIMAIARRNVLRYLSR